MPADLDVLIAKRCAALLRAYDATGHGPFRAAAQYLERASYCDRGEIDDSEALAEIRARIEAGDKHAVRNVALARGESESTERRWRAKLKKTA